MLVVRTEFIIYALNMTNHKFCKVINILTIIDAVFCVINKDLHIFHLKF